jgi:hypothetical protein
VGVGKEWFDAMVSGSTLVREEGELAILPNIVSRAEKSGRDITQIKTSIGNQKAAIGLEL